MMPPLFAPRNALALAPEVLNLVYSLTKAYQDYQQKCEQETTRRQQIATWEKAVLAEIETKRQLLLSYLEHSFAERRHNFQELFAKIDQAIAQRDNTQLSVLLQALVTLAQTTPFKDLATLSQVQANLANPDHVWEL
ncbi:MAG: hypothetical protein NZL92_09720 [Gloeomargarita sp. SKYG116]|nr:hypothetical protein [Gloeomargarita sp. SKYG116]MCS7225415.1 hypothetical protein [Gloeomargarita sp. SKYB31]MDW8401960.1 hypothetical protein [Gloeomargarita sp. SKYGB_i_bin116]